MNTYQRAYLVGTHRYSFQSGKPGEIIGVKMVQVNPPKDLTYRPCFHVRFENGQEEWVPIFLDQIFHEVISEEDVRAGRIPEVVH